MTLPVVRLIRQFDTHRLVPSKYSEGAEGDESVLTQIAEDDAHLQDLFDLDNVTNGRLLAENDRLPGIGIHELVFGVPYYRIVNAAFCHAHPLGSRFNGPDRGAWYAAFELETARAEVAFHKWLELAEVGWLHEEVRYDDYLADFSAELHDLREDERRADCLAPDSYVASQRLAQELLEAGSLGIVYQGVRRRKGTCLACFRPSLVMNVRKGATWAFRWEGRPKPVITAVSRAARAGWRVTPRRSSTGSSVSIRTGSPTPSSGRCNAESRPDEPPLRGGSSSLECRSPRNGWT